MERTILIKNGPGPTRTGQSPYPLDAPLEHQTTPRTALMVLLIKRESLLRRNRVE